MSSLSLDLDELNTLVQQGNLKIVDITKNPNNGMDEDELDESVIVSKPSEDLDLTYEEMDGNEINQNNENSEKDEDEETNLGFPEGNDDFEDNSVSEPKSDMSFQQKDVPLPMQTVIEESQSFDEDRKSVV